jgi:S1-C subfamily serine protease
MLRALAFASLLVALTLPPAAGLRAQATDPPTDALSAGAYLDAVIAIRALVPGDAGTAAYLGTERTGTGVVIDAEAGVVLTIGYLVLEAGSVELVLPGGKVVAGEVLAYDYDTGFGLVRAALPADTAEMPLGDSRDEAREQDRALIVVARDDERTAAPAVVVSRRDFAGFWEYLLPNAIFTSPYQEGYGGAALVSREGELLGIGSLAVGDAAGTAARGGRQVTGNMFVPVEALAPIYDDLLRLGRSAGPPRPWLGLHTAEVGGLVVVRRVTAGGPADRDDHVAFAKTGSVGPDPVLGQADFYRKIWSLGDAGVAVPLTVMRKEGRRQVSLRSADRYDFLRLDGSF